MKEKLVSDRHATVCFLACMMQRIAWCTPAPTPMMCLWSGLPRQKERREEAERVMRERLAEVRWHNISNFKLSLEWLSGQPWANKGILHESFRNLAIVPARRRRKEELLLAQSRSHFLIDIFGSNAVKLQGQLFASSLCQAQSRRRSKQGPENGKESKPNITRNGQRRPNSSNISKHCYHCWVLKKRFFFAKT